MSDDETKIRLGLERLGLLRAEYGNVAHLAVVEGLTLRIVARGFEPRADVVAHVVGNVPEHEWRALVERGVQLRGWEKVS